MRLIITLPLLFLCLVVSADSWVRLHGKSKITPGKKSASVNWHSYATWGPEAERDRTVTFNIYAPKSDQWADFSLSFTMVEDGWVNISLQGPWKKNGDKLERIDVVFSDIKCEGAELKNGMFANVKENIPGWWNMHKNDDASAPFCIKDGIVVWHNGFYNQLIQVKKDAVVTITGKTRMAKKEDYAGKIALLPKAQEERLLIRAGEEWKAIDMTKMSVKPGSALDLSGIHEPGPAGKYGRAVIDRNGDFAFEKRPDKPVRFFAFNAFANHLMTWKESMLLADTPEKTRANIKEFAGKVRRQGYNMMRFQGVDLLLMGKDAPGDARFSPANLDYFHYMLHCLKEEGVYFGIDLFSYTGYRKFESQWFDAVAQRYKERMYFDPEARQMWLDGVKALMTVKNPYTGLPLGEEPALIYVDMHNEQELGIWVAREPLTMGGVKPLAEKAWRDFLRKRYSSDIGALGKSWNATFDSFDAVPLFGKGDLHAGNSKGKDVNDFLYGHEKEMLDFYRKGLETINCKTFATLYDVLGYFRFTSIRRDVPVITSHGYHNHPTANNNPGSKMGQNSINGNAAQYLRYMSTMRVWNRPFLITEYNAPFWGRYRHQEGLILPAYAALQNYAGITAHSLVVSRLSVPLEDFQIGRDPIGRAGQVIAAFSYGRGDVSTAKHKVGVALSEEFMRDIRNMNHGVSAEQNRIVLLSGLGVVLDGKIPAGLPPYPKLELTMLPTQGSEIVARSMFTVPVEKENASSFADVVKTLRGKKILSAANKTDAERGIYQSDTGELTMDSKENLFTADTPKLQGAAWEGDREVALSGVAFKSSVSCTAALISLDGKKIGETGRLLLVYSTDALNSGMELSADRTTLYKLGTLPVLLQAGVLEVSLAKSPSLRCFALGIDGERLEELPVVRSGDGCKVTIDTAKLKNGPAVYFEFAMK